MKIVSSLEPGGGMITIREELGLLKIYIPTSKLPQSLSISLMEPGSFLMLVT